MLDQFDGFEVTLLSDSVYLLHSSGNGVLISDKAPHEMVFFKPNGGAFKKVYNISTDRLREVFDQHIV